MYISMSTYNSVYDSPSIDMLDYGDNSGCWELANEAHLGYEYVRYAYVCTEDDLSTF